MRSPQDNRKRLGLLAAAIVLAALFAVFGTRPRAPLRLGFRGYQFVTMPQAGLNRTRCAVFKFDLPETGPSLRLFDDQRVITDVLKVRVGSDWGKVTCASCPGTLLYPNPSGGNGWVAVVPMTGVATNWKFEITSERTGRIRLPGLKAFRIHTKTTRWTSGEMSPPD